MPCFGRTRMVALIGRSAADEWGGGRGEPGGSSTGIGLQKKGARGGNMVPPTGASSRRATSSQDDCRVGEVVGEGDLREALERLDVPRPGSLDDLLRKVRAGRGLAPGQRLAIVADELLVER